MGDLEIQCLAGIDSREDVRGSKAIEGTGWHTEMMWRQTYVRGEPRRF